MILSIGMIVKNEGKNLRDCLNGIKPILEQVESELIIADTGSSDDTVKIAREFTENVFSIEWRGDFAWARNTTIDRAGGQWFMFLDGDEIFQDVSEIIRFFNSGEYKEFRSASHRRVDKGNDHDETYVRLYRKEKNTRFVNKIHEQIPLQLPVKRLGVLSLHLGNVFEGEEGQARRDEKYRRNMDPLIEMHRDDPKDLRTLALIVNEAMAECKYEDARKYIDIGLGAAKDLNDVFYHFLRQADLACLTVTGDFTGAAMSASDYFKNTKKTFTLSINMRLTEAHALEELKRRAEAINAYKEALILIDKYNKGELDDEDILMGVSGSLPEGAAGFAMASIACQYAWLGDFESANSWANKLEPKAKDEAVKTINTIKKKNAAAYAPTSARAKLDKETAALKQMVYTLIKSGQLPMAGQVLKSYGQVNPDDPDIKSIQGIINRAISEGKAGPEPGKPGILEKLNFLDKVETVFILSNISATGTGVSNSVLNKVKLIAENFGYYPAILVCDYNAELRRVQLALTNEGKLSRGTRVISVYNYLQKSYADNLESNPVYVSPDDGLKRVHKGQGVYEAYDGEKAVKREYFTGFSGALRKTEYLNSDKVTKAEYYDDWGYLSKVREFDKNMENYYTTGGKLCIKAFCKHENTENIIERLELYGENGYVVREFKDNAELAAFCLEQIINDDKLYLLVIENGLTAKAATTVNKKNVSAAMVVHSAFLEDSYDINSRPQYYYEYLCGHRDEFSGITFSTQDEAGDFIKKYGGAEKVFVIPHPYPSEIIKADFESRDHKRAVIVSRLDSLKQIDMAVEIFAMALKKIPDIKLDIYGVGDELERLKELIKSMGLSGSVFLKGFTDKPSEAFRKAGISIMTSKVEGYGLTLAESICNGCPAMAFDIKYGPSDIIKDGQTGYLISRFDKKAYAAKLIEFFKDKGLQRTMSENCYSDAERFGAEEFLERWYDFTKTAASLLKDN